LAAVRITKEAVLVSLEDIVDKLRKKTLGFRDRKELILEENTKGDLLSALGWACSRYANHAESES
jgi:hypothetical protein